MGAFSIEDDEEAEEDLASILQALLSEVRLMQAKLSQIGVPKPLHEEVASSLRNFFSPAQLNAGWNGLGQTVDNERTTYVLAWADWALTKFNEKDISQDALEELKANIAAQEAILSDNQLPESLREILERQLSSIRAALKLYEIQGIKPLEEAVNRAIGEMATAPSEVVEEAHSTAESRSALKKAVEIISGAAKVANSGSQIVKFGKEIIEIGNSASSTLAGLLNNNPFTGG